MRVDCLIDALDGLCYGDFCRMMKNGRFAASVDMLAEFCDALDAELVVRKKEG